MSNTYPTEISAPLQAAFETFARQSGVHVAALAKLASGRYTAPPIQLEYEQFSAAVMRCLELVRAYEDSAGRTDDIADYLQRKTASEITSHSERAGLQAVCEAVAKIDWTRIDEKLGEGADQLQTMLLGAPGAPTRRPGDAPAPEPTPEKLRAGQRYYREPRHVVPEGVPHGNVFEPSASGEVMTNPRAWRCATANVGRFSAYVELLTFQRADGIVGQEHRESSYFHDLVATGSCRSEDAHGILDRWGTHGEIPERFKLSQQQQELQAQRESAPASQASAQTPDETRERPRGG